MSRMKAIVYYTNFYRYMDIYEKKYPIFSLIDFTAENLLKIKDDLKEDIIITDGSALRHIHYYYNSLYDSIEDLDEGSEEYVYVCSFSYRELYLLHKHPEEFLVVEVYNGHRE